MSLKLGSDLMLVIKLILSLFHGNASVERGFKVNKDSLDVNMSERSVCSLRFVHDSLTNQMKDNEIGSIPISDNLVASVQQARKRYRLYLEENSKQEKAKVRHHNYLYIFTLVV